MFLIDKILLVASVLMILGILSSKFSARLGMPVLVLFLGLGMIAGSEGVGLPFENYELAHAIGSVALAIILFDGGLRSPLSSLRIAWKPSAVLATWGVLVTSVVTGAVAAWALGLPLLEGMLLGSIVGSTDAAAVFAQLRNAGIKLRLRLASTLEIESGANDPMAIFLTVGILQVLTNQVPFGPELIGLFAMQMGVGLVVGFGVGWLSVQFINRINLGAAGLYPLLTAACGLLAFGVAALLQGSGFLAIYVAGAVLGNSKLVFQRGTLLFHDGIAWASQIAMFVVLGLLSNPSQLLTNAGPSLLIAVALFLVARPLAVVPVLIPFRFSWREILLVSWVGLKGAVPIILATYPLLFGIPSGQTIFNVVFFVVLLSAVLQGGSLPFVARRLGLDEPPEPAAPLSLEISSLRDVEAEIVDYLVKEDSRAANRTLRDLALPQGAVVAMISRGKTIIPPRGSSQVRTGDHVFIVTDRESREPVDRLFASAKDEARSAIVVEFPLAATTTAGDLAALYDLRTGERPDRTLDEIIRARNSHPSQGDVLVLGGVRLRVREVRDGKVAVVGLALGAEQEEDQDQAPA